jgi:hypothetical protein
VRATSVRLIGGGVPRRMVSSLCCEAVRVYVADSIVVVCVFVSFIDRRVCVQYGPCLSFALALPSYITIS